MSNKIVMSSFDRGLWDAVKDGMIEAPVGQISEDIRVAIKTFADGDETKTPKQIYEFMDSISKAPPTEISSFVQVLFDVRRFYAEPA